MDDEEELKEDYDVSHLKRRKERIEKKSESMRQALGEQNYQRTISKFQITFDNHMRELLQVLTQSKRYETHIANLATRLDFNGYYSEMFLNDDQIVL